MASVPSSDPAAPRAPTLVEVAAAPVIEQAAFAIRRRAPQVGGKPRWPSGDIDPVRTQTLVGELAFAAQPSSPRSPSPLPGLPSPPPAPQRKRWSGSAWIIARNGGGGSLLSPLLGGSQAGVRIAYALDREGRVAAFTRFAAPLKRGPVELALGGQWKPGRAPVTVYAEARASDGRVAPAAGVFGGGVVDIGRGWRLDGYGQAGVIDREGVSGFGDGQARLVKRLGRFEAGAGLWGATQRDARRLDIGPSIAVPIQVEPLAFRLTLDWRHRVAGNARPASGPALSLGTDF